LICVDPAAASAKPLTADELSAWYCKNLHAPFDFSAAAASFPFDKLDDVKTSQSTRPGSGGPAHTSVQKVAKGHDYTVTYTYQFSEENVSDPYGFYLSVDPNTRDFSTDPTVFPREWLSGFGKPVYNMMGYEVGSGPGTTGMSGSPTSFSYWTTTGTILANWFSPADIAGFSALCASRQKR
jgi:hypothetical protein